MKKDLLVLAFIVLLVVVLARGTKIQSVDEYYLTHIDEITYEAVDYSGVKVAKKFYVKVVK